MSFTGTQFTISSSALAIAAYSTNANGPYRVVIQMTSGVAYIGSSAVTSSGFPLTTAAGERLSVVLSPGETLYAASTAGVAGRTLVQLNF